MVEKEPADEKANDKGKEEEAETTPEDKPDKTSQEQSNEPSSEPSDNKENTVTPEADKATSKDESQLERSSGTESETGSIETTTKETDTKSKQPKDTPEPKKKKQKVKSDVEQKPGDRDQEIDPDFKYIIRVANTNIDGNYTIPRGLAAIKGIGIRLGTTITDKLGLPRDKKVGNLTDSEVEKLSEIVKNLNTEIPGWMMNRQNDIETGDNLHIISADIQQSLRDDLNRLKKIRCYRGIRHEQGQKVRGQRTRANGRTGLTVGVMKKRVKQQMAKAGKSGK